MGLYQAKVQGPRDSKAPAAVKPVGAKPSDVLDARREIETFEPTQAPTATPDVPEGLKLFFGDTQVSHLQMAFHKDTSIFVMDGTVSSAATEKQIDVYSPEGPGRYCRPRALAEAKIIVLGTDGALHISWKNGRQTYVTPTAVASFTVDV